MKVSDSNAAKDTIFKCYMTYLIYLFSKYLKIEDSNILFDIYKVMKSKQFIDSIPLKSSIEQELRLLTFKAV